MVAAAAESARGGELVDHASSSLLLAVKSVCVGLDDDRRRWFLGGRGSLRRPIWALTLHVASARGFGITVMTRLDATPEDGDFDDVWQRAVAALSHHGMVSRLRSPPRHEADLDVLCCELLKAYVGKREKVVFHLLIECCEPYLHRICHRLARFREMLTADELVCDTLASVFMNATGFVPKGRSAFFRWLNIISKNHARMADRARRRRRRREQQAAVCEDGGGEDPIKILLDADQHVLDAELVQKLMVEVNACLARLPDRTREFWRMRWEEGMSHSAIARAFGTTEGAVTMRIKRARAFIERELKAKGMTLPTRAVRSREARA